MACNFQYFKAFNWRFKEVVYVDNLANSCVIICFLFSASCFDIFKEKEISIVGNISLIRLGKQQEGCLQNGDLQE
jgi:hypothetical protein